MISKDELSSGSRSNRPTQRRGKHRIYIGMSPGVGKTYRMLREAHALKEQGIDVVIGLLETHGRQETAEQAEQLELIPRQTIERRGVTLTTEMNINAILARQPQLVLVDELAHTNISGSTHEKRYQDVETILAAGINVFSTVNIQHLESLNDLVAKLTGVVVRERIPDRLLDEADEVIVVDVTPETLQERLREGKIYAPEKIEQSLRHFFQRRNLIALRELALREVADNLEETAESSTPDGHSYCSVHERVMVCISTYPNATNLLRRGGRLANQLRARLYVLYVDRPDSFLTKAESLQLETCAQLCRQFEGEFLRVKSAHVRDAIVEQARNHYITQIILGHTQKSRWQLLLRGSIDQYLLRHLRGVDLHVIATEE